MNIRKQYIFPLNYKRKEKFLGIIDYKVVIFIVILSAIILFIIKNININISLKIFIFIFFVGVPSIFVLVGINGENMIDFLYFIIKYLLKGKVFVYMTEEEESTYDKIYKKLVPYKKD